MVGQLLKGRSKVLHLGTLVIQSGEKDVQPPKVVLPEAQVRPTYPMPQDAEATAVGLVQVREITVKQETIKCEPRSPVAGA